MPLTGVAQGLDLSVVDLHDTITGLAAGGVLSQTSIQTLEVYPAPLRHALVRHMFFAGAASLPRDCFERLLNHSPSLGHTARTLAGARARGAPIDDSLLQDLLVRADDTAAWRSYVTLGHSEAEWVLQQRPALLVTVAESGLKVAPEMVIPMLLDAAVGDTRPLHSHPGAPLRILRDWTAAAVPGTGEALRRRQAVLAGVTTWARDGDPGVVLEGLRIAFHPQFEESQLDPVNELVLHLRRGSLTEEEVSQLQSLWSEARSLLLDIEPIKWSILRELVHEWAYPGTIPHVSQEVSKRMRALADMILRDVLEAAPDSQALRRWASEVAVRAGLPVGSEIQLDPVFLTLYPNERLSGDNWSSVERQQREHAQELADTWSQLPATTVAERLVSIERDATQVGLGWPRYTDYVCRHIAANTDTPKEWFHALVSAEANADLVEPFLARALTFPEGWSECWCVAFESPSLRPMAVMIALTNVEALPDVLEAAYASIDGLSRAIEFACRRGTLPPDRLLHFLSIPDQELAVSVAVGLASREQEIPPEVEPLWRDAILRVSDNEFALRRAFARDPKIAADWILFHLQKTSDAFWRHDGSLTAATEALDPDRRREILQQLPGDGFGTTFVVRSLVGTDPELYDFILSLSALQGVHLAPLQRPLGPEWIALAIRALDAGYSPEEVAAAPHEASAAWTGNESDMWAEWVTGFRELESQPDPRIQQVGLAGREHADTNRERALTRERQEAVRGRFS